VSSVQGSSAGTPTTYATNIQYASHGPVSQLSLANGSLLETRTYSPDRRQLISISAGALNLGYFYCPNGGMSCSTNNDNLVRHTVGSLTQDYTYTETVNGQPFKLNRLATATESGGANEWAQTYGYDQYGNRWVSGTMPNSSFTPTALTNFDNKNRLQINGATYDNNGNQKQIGGYTFVYDGESRQTSSTLSAGTTYSYDGDGRRVMKVSGGVTTVYVYDALGELAAESSTSPLSMPCLTCYLTADALGSTRMMTNESGIPKSYHDYFPFGEEITVGTGGRSGLYGGADQVAQKFTAKERDAETGLDSFGPRYMSSAQGRFTSPDAIFFQASMLTDPQRFNLYAYVGNNPLRYVDPTGEAIELLGDEEQRKKALEALKQAVGDKAGQYLKIDEKKGWFGLGKTHYVVAVSDQKAFANSNAIAGELNPIIQDSRTITVGFVGSGATVALDSGQRVALNPTTTDAMGNPVGTPAVSGLIGGSVGTRMIDPSQPLGIFPGILMSNGQPSPLDPGLTLAHELGHDWAILTHDFRTVLGNPYNTDAAALRLENKVREVRDPSGAQRLFHNPPGR
jgi:RHS repeat-associated protein